MLGLAGARGAYSSAANCSMEITWTVTQRGFVRGEFTDHNARECSIQESSLATEEAIWIGLDGDPPSGGQRMHLTRDQVAALWPVLQQFHDVGNLGFYAPDEDEDEDGTEGAE
jgi:hypothetical protein